MAIQTQTFKKRVRAHSGLSPQALLVAIVIADLRYESRVHTHEPLPLPLAELARECGMSRRAVVRYLNECLTSGWIIGRSVFDDGRQKPNEYFVVDPTDEAEYTRMYSVIAAQPHTECTRVHSVLGARVAHKVDMRLHTVLRSKNNGVGDAAPQAAGVGDEQDEPTSPPTNVPHPRTAAALEGATTDADTLAREIEYDVLLELDRLNAIRARGRNRLPRVPA